MREYWFRVNDIDCFVEVSCIMPDMDNITPFLEMARHSALREAVAAMRADPEGRYHCFPGEYLELTAEDGWVTAQITWCDAIPCRATVDFFCQLVEDYLETYEEMLRRRGR